MGKALREYIVNVFTEGDDAQIVLKANESDYLMCSMQFKQGSMKEFIILKMDKPQESDEMYHRLLK